MSVRVLMVGTARAQRFTARPHTIAIVLVFAILAMVLACMPTPAHAHRSSDAYLAIGNAGPGADGQQRLQVRWDIALRDLDARLDLDSDRDGRLNWREVRTRQHDIEALALSALSVSSGGKPCVAGQVAHALEHHSDGTYAVLTFSESCPAVAGDGSQIGVRYDLFDGFDAGHRAILTSGSQTQVLVPGNEPVALNIGAPRADAGRVAAGDSAAGRADDANAQPVSFGSFVATGIHHILIGWDHLAFLALLVIPSVLTASGGRWLPAQHGRDSLRELLLTVSAFTVAHSITLSLAATRLMVPNPAVIEPLIALSIVAAAVLNLKPHPVRRNALLAFGFGLVHGFGFASALGDAGLTGMRLAMALLGFNVGVEIGQIAFIAIVWGPLWATRNSNAMRSRAVPAMSLLLGALGMLWFVQRVFD